MKILSDKYDDARAKLGALEACFRDTEAHIKGINAAIEQVTPDEAALLIVEIGRIMGKHAENMEKM